MLRLPLARPAVAATLALLLLVPFSAARLAPDALSGSAPAPGCAMDHAGAGCDAMGCDGIDTPVGCINPNCLIVCLSAGRAEAA
jgi:hypothetical protein